MRKPLYVLVLIIASIQLMAQPTVEDYIKTGIQHHDSGQYEKAIEVYQEALKLSPKSALANYEIAWSYFSLKDYEKAIEHADIVLKQKDQYMLEAYVVKGSALDVMGKAKESIRLLEKGIKQIGGHYLLYYNLALNYYKQADLDKAEENVINAIAMNQDHASSHLMLADIHDQKGNPVQTLLAAHYFLFLEPNSPRSPRAYQMLRANFGGNVSQDDDDPNNINIMLSSSVDNEFSTVELMISMLEASKSLEENEGKSEDEMFIENTTSFFNMLGGLKKKKNKEIWWAFYTTLFYDLAKSEHMEAYCKYISQSGDENAAKWLTENQPKLIAFDTWLRS